MNAAISTQMLTLHAKVDSWILAFWMQRSRRILFPAVRRASRKNPTRHESLSQVPARIGGDIPRWNGGTTQGKALLAADLQDKGPASVTCDFDPGAL